MDVFSKRLTQQKIKSDLINSLNEDFERIINSELKIKITNDDGTHKFLRINVTDNFYVIRYRIDGNFFDSEVCNFHYVTVFTKEIITNFSDLEKMYCENEELAYFIVEYQLRDKDKIVLVDYDISFNMFI